MMSNAGLDVWEVSGDGSCSVVMCVADVISSTDCQTDGEVVLAEAVVVSYGDMEAVVDVLMLTGLAVGPTAVLFSVF